MRSNHTPQPRPGITVPGATTHTLTPRRRHHGGEGELRYLKAGTGAPWFYYTRCARRPSTSAS